MMPKINVSPIPSSAYVPPRTSILTRCCRNSLNANPKAERQTRQGKGEGDLIAPRPDTTSILQRLHADFAVADLDEINVGLALAAFLAFGTGLLEHDVAVEALDVDRPQGRLDRSGVGLAGFFDRRRGGADAVIATEALGASGEIK